LRLPVLKEAHTNSYTGPRLIMSVNKTIKLSSYTVCNFILTTIAAFYRVTIPTLYTFMRLIIRVLTMHQKYTCLLFGLLQLQTKTAPKEKIRRNWPYKLHADVVEWLVFKYTSLDQIVRIHSHVDAFKALPFRYDRLHCLNPCW
jgi:hypothetical protein